MNIAKRFEILMNYNFCRIFHLSRINNLPQIECINGKKKKKNKLWIIFETKALSPVIIIYNFGCFFDSIAFSFMDVSHECLVK